MLRFVILVESKGWWEKLSTCFSAAAESSCGQAVTASPCLPRQHASLHPSFPPHLSASRTPQANLTKKWEGGKQTSLWWCREGGVEQDKDMKIEEAGEMRLKAVPPGPNQDSPACVCLPIDEHVPVLLYARFCVLWLCVTCAPIYYSMYVCMCVWSYIQCMCVVYACRLSSGWLCSSSHSQLLITQHLFCPRSTLFCAYYQPGSLHRIRQRALSNTLLLKSLSSAVFSLVQHCRGHLCPCLLKAKHRAVKHLSPAVLAHSLNLSLELKPVYSVWWHYDNQERISSIPLPVQGAPWCVFWDSLACIATLARLFIRVAHAVTPLTSGVCVSRPWLTVSMRSWRVEWW